MWLEAVLLNSRLAHRDGELIETLTPFELTKKLIRIGARGKHDLEWNDSDELIIMNRPDAVLFEWAWKTNSRVRVEAGGRFLGHTGPVFRVLAARRDSAGWPASVAVPPAPWDDSMLHVLGDHLLEQGYAVGARFQRRDAAEDASWVPVLSRLAPRKPELVWRNGVVDELLIAPDESWAFGVSLARHAVCKPMRKLTLDLQAFDGDKAQRVVGGLISGGGLPCLERLRCVVPESNAVRLELKRTLESLPAAKAAFPALKSIEVPER